MLLSLRFVSTSDLFPGRRHRHSRTEQQRKLTYHLGITGKQQLFSALIFFFLIFPLLHNHCCRSNNAKKRKVYRIPAFLFLPLDGIAFHLLRQRNVILRCRLFICLRHCRIQLFFYIFRLRQFLWQHFKIETIDQNTVLTGHLKFCLHINAALRHRILYDRSIRLHHFVIIKAPLCLHQPVGKRGRQHNIFPYFIR